MASISLPERIGGIQEKDWKGLRSLSRRFPSPLLFVIALLRDWVVRTYAAQKAGELLINSISCCQLPVSLKSRIPEVVEGNYNHTLSVKNTENMRTWLIVIV